MNDLVVYNKGIDQFELFLCMIFIFMTISKRYTQCITIDILRRKINQYTNWNLFMMACNSIMYNFYGIDNIFLSKFLALNSLQIFLLYHGFVLYDSRILFDILDNGKPFLLNIGAYQNAMIQLEYLIINFFIHILPAYTYRHYLIQKLPCEYEMNISIYTILFKFMWALNVFGNFNVISIYLPTFKFCSVKLFNMIVILDYAVGTIFEVYKHVK